MPGFYLNGLEDHKLVFIHGRSCDFIGAIEPHNQDIDDKAIELEYKRSKLQAHQQSIVVGMVHVLEIYHYVVLCGHIVSDVVVNDQPQEPVQQS